MPATPSDVPLAASPPAGEVAPSARPGWTQGDGGGTPARARYLEGVLLALGGGAWAVSAVLGAFGAGGGGPAFTALVITALTAASATSIVTAVRADKARTGRILVAAGVSTFSATATYYSLVPSAAERFPSWLDFGFFASYPLIAAGAALVLHRRLGGLSTVRWLDCVIGALGTASLGMTIILPSLGEIDDAATFGQLLFFGVDAGLAGFMIAVYALSGWRAGLPLLVPGLGIVALGVGDGSWLVAVADGAANPGPLPLVAWPAGMLLLAAASLRGTRDGRLSSSAWASTGVPVVAAVVCLPIVLLASEGAPHGIIAAASLVLVVVRLTLSLLENARLLATVEQSSVTDALTGLGNRTLLFDRLELLLLRQLRRGGLIAVLFLDLDDFKDINDAYGHDVGDAVLVSVAERLCADLRGEDTIARGAPADGSPRARDVVGRLGGDEFVVVLDALEEPADAAVVAERIAAALCAPLAIGDEEIELDVSIGIAVGDGALGRGPAELLRDADTAMYEAKRSGKGSYRFFEDDMRRAVVARTAMIRDLRRAVEADQLRLVYQPQVDLRTGRMTGVEALVRWDHPALGLLTPDRFIALAEASGLIVAIDDWVLHEACAQMRAWDDAGLPALEMAVNVSARRLVSGDLPRSVDAALREVGVAPARLEIEITETVAVDHDADAVAVITAVRALGVRVAIDDFGMGHSALSRLRTFPVDRLKIDRSFVSPLSVGTERGSIADAMIALGRSLGLQVIAEGVETDENLAALRNLGCGAAQGYLFSRPVAPGDIHARLTFDARPAPPPEDPPSTSQATEAYARERLVRTLLAELQRLTGLETTYLTRIDWPAALQHITHARNTGTIEVTEGLAVDWSDTVCRRALEQGVTYTDDVPAAFPDSQAAADLGLRTYVSVPLHNRAGGVEGTLCGASSVPVVLGPEVVTVMESFASIIGDAAGPPVEPKSPPSS